MRGQGGSLVWGGVVVKTSVGIVETCAEKKRYLLIMTKGAWIPLYSTAMGKWSECVEGVLGGA